MAWRTRQLSTSEGGAGYIYCYAALRWVWDNTSSLRVDRERLAVGGSSTEGALADVCALWARDDDGLRLCFHLLIYPVTGCRMVTASSVLRRTLFLMMSVILQRSPADEPVYQFMDKKHAEGKPYRVYMMASANKLLRIYYGKRKTFQRLAPL